MIFFKIHFFFARPQKAQGQRHAMFCLIFTLQTLVFED